jgi:hypothetical protein
MFPVFGAWSVEYLLGPHCNLSAGNSSDFVKFTIYVMKKLDCTSPGESIMRRVCFSNFLFQHKCAHLGSKPGKPKWEKPGSHYITKSLPAILRRKSHTVVPLVVLSVVVILLSEYWRRACRVCTLNLIELDVVVVANQPVYGTHLPLADDGLRGTATKHTAIPGSTGICAQFDIAVTLSVQTNGHAVGCLPTDGGKTNAIFACEAVEVRAMSRYESCQSQSKFVSEHIL